MNKTRAEQQGQRARYMQQLRSLVHAVPKTEIHLHVEALATVDTIWTLMQKHKISHDDISTKDDLKRKFRITSLTEFIDLFINVIQNCFRDEADIGRLTDDAERYLSRNNIVYAEIFFAPTKFLMNGLDFGRMIETLDGGARDVKKRTGIEIKFIIDVSRGFGVENAERNLHLTLDHPADSVIGIGLGGAEEMGPARTFQPIFERAAAEGLHLVAHAGEDVGPESIWEAIQYLKVERIGHGISAVQDEKLMDYLAETGLPLEVCPTSNLFTQRYVKRIEDHPIRAFLDRGINATVNTDDPTLFGIDLIDEYMTLANKGFVSSSEIVRLLKNNVYATFLPETAKDAIWRKAEEIIVKHDETLARA